MSFNQASAIVILATLLAAWWLSSFDARIIGDARGWDLLRRILRCLLTAAMAELVLWCFWRYSRYGDAASGLIPIPIFLLLAYFWAGAVGEIASRGFGKLFDSDGRRAYDPRKGEEGLRQLSKLAEEGRQEEALRLSEKLKKSGDTNIIVLETMMQRLGVDEKHVSKQKSLALARRLEGEGRFAEAERVLAGLLKQHPDYTEAAVFLIKIYAQDMGNGAKAAAAFGMLKQQSGTSLGMVEFARSMLAEVPPIAVEPLPVVEPERTGETASESVDELIAQRRFATAITALKNRLREEPDDFETWMKLAEVNGRYCGSFQQVENIIRLLAAEPQIQPEQVELLRTRLQEWRTEWKVGKTPSPVPENLPVTAKGPPEQATREFDSL